ncbi:hypothetical protein Mapa_010977 [Marchantia paleacea]|nr:hypothetical protein Mapa_010977 [Marchantia paleacea]
MSAYFTSHYLNVNNGKPEFPKSFLRETYIMWTSTYFIHVGNKLLKLPHPFADASPPHLPRDLTSHSVPSPPKITAIFQRRSYIDLPMLRQLSSFFAMTMENTTTLINFQLTRSAILRGCVAQPRFALIRQGTD